MVFGPNQNRRETGGQSADTGTAGRVMTKDEMTYHRAMDALRLPGSRMIQTFSFWNKPDYSIVPNGGRVSADIAKRIMAHPQVTGGKDALFPGHHQTWRMHPDSDDAA